MEDKISKDPNEIKDKLPLDIKENKTQLKTTTKAKVTPFPEERANPFVNQNLEIHNSKSVSLGKSYKVTNIISNK